jgi:hypothetical protein
VISTAIALQNATQDAVHDPMVMDMARELYQSRYMSDDEFIGKIYRYSAMLASLTTTLATNVLLTESQIDDLLGTINEMESMGKDLDNGNE